VNVTLDQGQQAVARLLAQLRHQNNRANGVPDRKVGQQPPDYTDLNGIGGELAFCILANVCPDMSISPRSGSYDCLLNGYRVDVKTTRYVRTPMLCVYIGKRLSDADIYVLMVGEMPVYRCAGWTWADELLRRENIRDLGYGPTYVLPSAALHPWEELEDVKNAAPMSVHRAAL